MQFAGSVPAPAVEAPGPFAFPMPVAQWTVSPTFQAPVAQQTVVRTIQAAAAPTLPLPWNSSPGPSLSPPRGPRTSLAPPQGSSTSLTNRSSPPQSSRQLQALRQAFPSPPRSRSLSPMDQPTARRGSQSLSPQAPAPSQAMSASSQTSSHSLMPPAQARPPLTPPQASRQWQATEQSTATPSEDSGLQVHAAAAQLQDSLQSVPAQSSSKAPLESVMSSASSLSLTTPIGSAPAQSEGTPASVRRSPGPQRRVLDSFLAPAPVGGTTQAPPLSSVSSPPMYDAPVDRGSASTTPMLEDTYANRGSRSTTPILADWSRGSNSRSLSPASLPPVVSYSPKAVSSSVGPPYGFDGRERTEEESRQQMDQALKLMVLEQKCEVLEQKCEAQQTCLAEKEHTHVQSLAQMVELVKSLMQSLCDEADLENSEMRNQLRLMHSQLEAAKSSAMLYEPGHQGLRGKLAESEATCESLHRQLAERQARGSQETAGYHAAGADQGEHGQLAHELAVLRREAVELRADYDQQWRHKSDSYEQLASELKEMRAALVQADDYDDDNDVDDTEGTETERSGRISARLRGGQDSTEGGERRSSKETEHGMQHSQRQLGDVAGTAVVDERASSSDVPEINLPSKRSLEETCRQLKQELSDALKANAQSQAAERHLAVECRLFKNEAQELAAAGLHRVGPPSIPEESVMEGKLVDAEQQVEASKAEAASFKEQLAISQGVVKQAMSEMESLRQALAESKGSAEQAVTDKSACQAALTDCEQAARLAAAERDAAKESLDSARGLADAFKQQAVAEIGHNRWFRFVVLLLRKDDSVQREAQRNDWTEGVKSWQAFAKELIEKLNSRPTTHFAQEIERHCIRGERCLHAMEEKMAAQGKQMSLAAHRAAQEFREAEILWGERLRREAARRERAEASLLQLAGSAKTAFTAADATGGEVEHNVGDVVADLQSSLEAERQEGDRLRKKLIEAEQTIGLLVVQTGLDTMNSDLPSHGRNGRR
eukprot:TRINITY_DN77275_c0_g1_i1.p1 TRINITY_DN77275_c0_g1~~TRINITY_DN77275_c0_g1_i1.p1  ORF type:complete len:1021 (+),score=232.50 TRINITY_DN77275_c0_g1_i1:66-3065(+)